MKTLVHFKKNDVLNYNQLGLIKGGDGDPVEIPVILEPTPKKQALSKPSNITGMANITNTDSKEEENTIPGTTTKVG